MACGGRTRQRRVLVVAEDPATRSQIAAVFEQAGYTVILGQDSIELLTLVEQQAPHAIVLHAALPSRLGLQAVQPLRRRSPERRIPVILVSVDATLLLDARSRQPQVLSHQPIQLDELVRQVGRLAP